MEWAHGLASILRMVAVLFGMAGGGFVGTVLAPLARTSKRRIPIVLLCAAFGGFAMWLAVNRLGGTGIGAGPGNSPDGYTNGDLQNPPAKPTAVESQVLRIQMLGGLRVKEQRFYVIDQQSPRNWDELMAVLAEHRRHDGELKVIEIVIYPTSVDEDNPAVTRLADWARDQHFTVKMAFPVGDATEQNPRKK